MTLNFSPMGLGICKVIQPKPKTAQYPQENEKGVCSKRRLQGE